MKKNLSYCLIVIFFSFYQCNACMVHGINDPACVYNYIATSVIVPDADVYVCSLRNVSHLAIITYQQEK